MSIRRGLAAWCVVAGAATLSAQGPTFSSRAEIVRVDVLVTDARGQSVRGLTAADFEVVDAGVPQRVDHVIAEELPLNVIVATDGSGSVTGEEAAQLRAASLAAIDDLKSGDKAALVTFDTAVSVRARPTANLAAVRAALEMPLAGAGDTALVDAAYASIVLADGDDARGLVMVFSDGADTASFLTPASVLDSARRAGSVVYGAVSGMAASPFLDALCDATGGRILRVESRSKVRDAFLAILDEFRHRYLIGYTPRGVPKSGWHSVSIRVRNRRVTVKTRPGYLRGS